jgi:hypothetical protein
MGGLWRPSSAGSSQTGSQLGTVRPYVRLAVAISWHGRRLSHSSYRVHSRRLVLELRQGLLQIVTQVLPAGDPEGQHHESAFDAAGLAERDPLHPAPAGGRRSDPQLPPASGAEDVGDQHPGNHPVRVGPVVMLPSPDPPELAAALGDLGGAVAERVDREALGVDPGPDLWARSEKSVAAALTCWGDREVSTSNRISTMIASFPASEGCRPRRPRTSVGLPILHSVAKQAVLHGEHRRRGAG